MIVGDVVKKKAPSFGDKRYVIGAPATMFGRVVYIHPRRRYYVIEFEYEGRTIRESYSFRGDN